ncbi:BURP domain - like 8 [Theobroma cacao]|nr:BURP domain - like 8 [Theobroma cacao]
MDFPDVLIDLYFLYTKLYVGNITNLEYLSKASKTTLFPQQITNSIPLSILKFLNVFKIFSFKANSKETHFLKKTIEDCERPKMENEEKKNTQLLSNQVKKKIEVHKFIITMGIKIIREQNIFCYKMNYPYAVFLCHSFVNIRIYKVTLVGTDGIRDEALTIYNRNTLALNPSTWVFKFLK